MDKGKINEVIIVEQKVALIMPFTPTVEAFVEKLLHDLAISDARRSFLLR